MIYLIQLFIKNTLAGCSGIPQEAILLNLEEALRYTTAPWASILPQSLEIEPKWQWDQANIEGGKTLKVRQKYQVLLPIEVNLRAENQEEAANYVHALLKALPRNTVLDNTSVLFEPSAALPSLPEGTLDLSLYQLIINCRYGIYEAVEAPLMNGVKIGVEKP